MARDGESGDPVARCGTLANCFCRCDLAGEGEIDELFPDCAHGAVPPIGECYGLDTIIDDAIDGQGDVYLDDDDQTTLVRLTHAQFAKLTADARHGRFSVHI